MGSLSFSNFTSSVFGALFVEGLFDNVLADYLWARSVVLTSPTVATVGLSITIPLAIVTDFLVIGIVPSFIVILGALLVVTGFLFVNFG